MLARVALLLGVALALAGCFYDPYYHGYDHHEYRHHEGR